MAHPNVNISRFFGQSLVQSSSNLSNDTGPSVPLPVIAEEGELNARVRKRDQVGNALKNMISSVPSIPSQSSKFSNSKNVAPADTDGEPVSSLGQIKANPSAEQIRKRDKFRKTLRAFVTPIPESLAGASSQKCTSSVKAVKASDGNTYIRGQSSTIVHTDFDTLGEELMKF